MTSDALIRSHDSNKNHLVMEDALLSAGRNGRVGMLRARAPGRPSVGGAIRPETVTARTVSEYMHQCLTPYLFESDLWNANGVHCAINAEDGVRSCPDNGTNELTGNPKDKRIVMDSAKPHLPPSGSCAISAFDRYAREQLGLAGVIFTPPYSPKFNVVELLFSYLHRYVRKFAPTTLEGLVQRLREGTNKVTGQMILGWCKKAGYKINTVAALAAPDEEEKKVDEDEEIVPPCNRGADARFRSQEHVTCVTDTGRLMRHKPRGKRRWQVFRVGNEALVDISVPPAPARAALPAVSAEAATRWTGIGPRTGEECKTKTDLFTNDEDCGEVKAVIGERVRKGVREFKVRWASKDRKDSWLTSVDFTAGLQACLREFKERGLGIAHPSSKEDKSEVEEVSEEDVDQYHAIDRIKSHRTGTVRGSPTVFYRVKFLDGPDKECTEEFITAAALAEYRQHHHVEL
jgi:transposase